MTVEASAETASTQAERTEESESRRRRRRMVWRILERKGERRWEWARARVVTSRTEWSQTGDLREESVWERQDRKWEKASGERETAMESSSAEAMGKVSRSASLLRRLFL